MTAYATYSRPPGSGFPSELDEQNTLMARLMHRAQIYVSRPASVAAAQRLATRGVVALRLTPEGMLCVNEIGPRL